MSEPKSYPTTELPKPGRIELRRRADSKTHCDVVRIAPDGTEEMVDQGVTWNQAYNVRDRAQSVFHVLSPSGLFTDHMAWASKDCPICTPEKGAAR